MDLAHPVTRRRNGFILATDSDRMVYLCAELNPVRVGLVVGGGGLALVQRHRSLREGRTAGMAGNADMAPTLVRG